MDLPDLPVTDVLDELAVALAERRTAVLVAPPGAGKTTLVPLALRDAAWLAGGKIVVLEPRRLATRASARRMAYLLDEEVGDTVGYRVRRDTRVGRETRIEVVTEGILTRMLQSDPGLDGIGLVVFDEFHERSLHADLGLALALQALRLLRDDLRLLVMSATLEAEPVAELVGAEAPAPIVASHGRAHPVTTRYLDAASSGPIEATVTRAITQALQTDEGDLLVFLPGAGEIRRTERRLRDAGLPDHVDVYPLFGNLSRREQDAAIAPSPAARRKVVLATAIAQTSLTIEGVRVVVDSGLMRVPRFDPGTGMTALETRRVTADVADQRRGRAGRTAPGTCYRLWTHGEQRGLVPTMRPEILDADLAPLVLELAVWGAGVDELAWLDRPPEPAVEQARNLLRQLDALDADDAVTEHGRRVAGLGTHPRLAHMLIRAGELQLGALGCALAGLLSQRDLLRRTGGVAEADVRLRLEAMRRPRGTVSGHEIHRGRLERARDEAGALRRALSVPARARVSAADVERAGELLCLAYPDRVARRRVDDGARPSTAEVDQSLHGTRYLLRNGRGALLPGGQGLSTSEWLVVSDSGDRGRAARIFQAAPVEQKQVEERFADQIEEVDEIAWNRQERRVDADRRRRLGALTLATQPLDAPDTARVTDAFLDGVRADRLRALPWNKKTRQLRHRLQFMHAADPERWPDVSRDALTSTLEAWLAPFVGGMRRLEELSRLDLAEVLWTHVGWQQRSELDLLAPTHLDVPSGSRIPLDYEDPEAPALAVRLQEIFGWTQTPRIAGGKVPVTLHLLSPAQRPVQVTSDLASFWQEAYFEVKKELKGRYPKHYWPDDPLTAQATRRVRPQ